MPGTVKSMSVPKGRPALMGERARALLFIPVVLVMQGRLCPLCWCALQVTEPLTMSPV